MNLILVLILTLLLILVLVLVPALVPSCRFDAGINGDTQRASLRGARSGACWWVKVQRTKKKLVHGLILHFPLDLPRRSLC